MSVTREPTYEEFIQNIINTRGQFGIPDGEYYENHHIIPKCLGGEPKVIYHTTKHENLIWLYPQEHYLAHKYLYEENKDNHDLLTAYWCLSHQTKGNHKIFINESEYKKLREEYSKMLTGKKKPPEVGAAISAAKKGKPLSDITKLRMKGPKSELHRLHMIEASELRGYKIKCVETGEIFPSVGAAARSISEKTGSYISTGNICSCCNGKRKTAYKYH